MSKSQWSDEQLIRMICGAKQERNQALQYVYHLSGWRAMVHDYILKNRGTVQDAEDAFQEAITIFDRAIRNNKFQKNSALSTYFFGIAKWYWLGQLRKRRPTDELPSQMPGQISESVEELVISEEKKRYLDEAIALLGERCKEVLGLYKLSYSMKEIAEIVQFSSADMAKKEAYDCRKKLKAFFKNSIEWASRVK